MEMHFHQFIPTFFLPKSKNKKIDCKINYYLRPVIGFKIKDIRFLKYDLMEPNQHNYACAKNS